MTNGRIGKTELWRSQDTGRSVRIRKISTLLRAEVRRQVLQLPEFAEPQPPTSMVDYGDTQIQVVNRSHPVYQEVLLDWNTRIIKEVSERLKLLVLQRGVVIDDSDIDQEAVAEVRAEVPGLDIYDDRHVYLAFVVIGTEEDWTDLLRSVLERSAPQEAAIQAHIATFQPDVQGASPVPSES